MNTYNIDLDLDKRHRGTTVIMRQGDKLGTTIIATLYDHGTAVTSSTLPASNLTVYMVMDLPDNQHYYRKAATYANGVITHNVDETSACSVAGRTEAYFELRQGTTVIASTESFTVVVLRSGTDGMTEGKDYDDEMDAMVKQWLDDHPEKVTTVQPNGIDTEKIAPNAVTNAKLAQDAVTNYNMADNSVDTLELVDGSVTAAKLHGDAVTTDKILDGSVTVDKLASGMFRVVTDAEIAAMLN